MIDILFLLAGFVVLIFGADKLVDSASSLAQRLGVPPIVIGLTIVAFGTSAPELVVNLFAASQQNTELVLGNVLGSNIFNVLAILGISALIYPLRVKTNTTWLEIPLSLLAALAALFIANDQMLDNENLNRITRSEGLMLLLFFSIFLVYNLQLAKNGQLDEKIEEHKYTLGKGVLYLLLGLAGLVLGGKLIVDGAVGLATDFGLSERIIGLTIVSVGTSLPELATSLVAVRKKNVDIAIGNVVGSNIFNIFFILGLSTVIAPVEVHDASLLDLGLNILASLLLFLFVLIGKGRQVVRWEGSLLFLLYLAYLGLLIQQA